MGLLLRGGRKGRKWGEEERRGEFATVPYVPQPRREIDAYVAQQIMLFVLVTEFGEQILQAFRPNRLI